MKFSVNSRGSGNKSENNKIRRAGDIPAVLYGKDGQKTTSLVIKGEEALPFFRALEPGRAATTIFELDMGKTSVRAIVKEIQYHRVDYTIEHLDFQEIAEKTPVVVNVPIRITGRMDCVGVKRGGGFIRQVIRSLKVRCLPKDIPEAVELDVLELDVAQARRLSDIRLPAGVKPLGKMGEVAVVIAKKKG